MNETTVQFGTQEFPLTSPKLKEGLAWRETLQTILCGMEMLPGAILRVNQTLVSQEQMIELVVSYPGLGVSKEFLLANANEAQLQDAYSKILVVAFRPWFELLGTMKSLRSALSWPPVDPAANKPQTN